MALNLSLPPACMWKGTNIQYFEFNNVIKIVILLLLRNVFHLPR
jgi:hypothetical protein